MAKKAVSLATIFATVAEGKASQTRHHKTTMRFNRAEKALLAAAAKKKSVKFALFVRHAAIGVAEAVMAE